MAFEYSKALFVAVVVSLPPTQFAQEPSLPPAAGPREGVVYVLDVQVRDIEEARILVDGGFDVAHVHGDSVEVYASGEEVKILQAAGFSFTISGKQPDSSSFTFGNKGLGDYNDSASITVLLHHYANAYPQLTRLVSIGKSVQGRDLWALLITDNPALEEAEPEFKYVSTMHGDEPIGTELCLYLIDYLLTRYGTDERVTRLVNETAIWFLPAMNPDGLDNITRHNAQGYDLNRAFPAYPFHFEKPFFDGGALSIDGRTPEVRHVMNWTLEHSFVLSANFHAGALIVNYPYDEDPPIPSFTPAPTPDEDLIRELSLRYSRQNTRMYTEGDFPEGVVNGSVWFAIRGGMQDWHYRYTGCIDVTIELNEIKRPSPTLIPQFWDENRESMLTYLETVHIGVRGIVTNKTTGLPVWAKALVDDNPQPVFTDPDVGDYYRLLLPGTYTLRFSAPGYITYTVPNVVVVEDAPTVLDIRLSDGDLDGDGRTGAADIQRLINLLLTGGCPLDCDLDGGELSATDLQALLNLILSTPTAER